MSSPPPSEIASNLEDETLRSIKQCIENRDSFVLEAGAGAGKTYSLILTLTHLIENHGRELLWRGQRVACITYTKAARDEIESRLDSHPAIWAATIHSFCWSLISGFQSALRQELPHLDKWGERLEESGGLGSRSIVYDLGFPSAKSTESISLGHNDVIRLTVKLLERPKFRSMMISRFPVLLIDEYQDTDKQFVESLKEHFLVANSPLLIGFFGDYWQKIYKDGCGFIDHPMLKRIDKHTNFRSSGSVVEVLNHMRPELPQIAVNSDAMGEAIVLHTNEWPETRLTASHWKGDLPPEAAHAALESIKDLLEGRGWVFTDDRTKILMLTHNVLADEQGYRRLTDLFPYNDAFMKKEDPYIRFFAEVLEPACVAFSDGRYGEMMRLVGSSRTVIRNAQEKRRWPMEMNNLLGLRENRTIGEVLDHVRNSKLPRLPDALEKELNELNRITSSQGEELSESLRRLATMRDIQFSEVSALVKFIEGHTPFATKHGVKGLEFEEVLVVVGRGWNQYDFNQMLIWAGTSVPRGKEDTFERSRNLFYVTCSRSIKRLAVLFTQELSTEALRTLQVWFGSSGVLSLPRP